MSPARDRAPLAEPDQGKPKERRGGALNQALGCTGSQRGPTAAVAEQSRSREPKLRLALRTSMGAHPPPRGPRAQPGVEQGAGTLKPNSWPETSAAATAAPGREEPSKRPACSDSDSARSFHERAEPGRRAALLVASAERGSRPPGEYLRPATTTCSVMLFRLEPGRKWQA